MTEIRCGQRYTYVEPGTPLVEERRILRGLGIREDVRHAGIGDVATGLALPAPRGPYGHPVIQEYEVLPRPALITGFGWREVPQPTGPVLRVVDYVNHTRRDLTDEEEVVWRLTGRAPELPTGTLELLGLGSV